MILPQNDFAKILRSATLSIADIPAWTKGRSNLTMVPRQLGFHLLVVPYLERFEDFAGV